METKSDLNLTTSAKEIKFERILDAPIDLVFDVFSDPEHLANWFGPEGFTITTHEMNFREGGKWLFTMHGPDGIDYPNIVKYTKIEAPNLIEFDQGGEDITEGISFHVVITLQEVNSSTHFVQTMVFPSEKILERVIKEFGAIEGAQQTVERLEKLLVQIQS